MRKVEVTDGRQFMYEGTYESHSPRGSGYLITAIVGGAVVPYLQGQLADRFGLTVSFLTAAPCYLLILYFARCSFVRRTLDADTGQRASAAGAEV